MVPIRSHFGSRFKLVDCFETGVDFPSMVGVAAWQSTDPNTTSSQVIAKVIEPDVHSIVPAGYGYESEDMKTGKDASLSRVRIPDSPPLWRSLVDNIVDNIKNSIL